ncbi:MAG: prolipoprotein diacylglyceryl transferase [Anaerolineae bacterium]|jgi:phosphatidylglycerol:prolipoprotein diacylglycerol transferase|nr:prolipoprotein diacylglyceryl transferase [Anaerolineae bacterium]
MEFGPQSITMGPVQIRYYGIIIVTAILVAAVLAARMAKRDGRDPDHVWGAMFWAVILGIIGARLWFVLFPPQSLIMQGRDTAWFFQNFTNLENGPLAIWSGGLSIWGAFLGGFIGSALYLRWNKLSFGPWLDIAAVALPLGQAIGRFANYVNQELYGLPTTLPWGIQIESRFRVGPYVNTVNYPLDSLFHPLFAYEMLWSLLFFVVLLRLWTLYRKQWEPGTIFLIYVAQYAFIRYVLEFIRVELSIISLQLGDQIVRINTTQVVCAVLFIGAVALLVPRLRAQPKPTATPSNAAA